ncbi:hypothetical protein SLA2020_448480 [Shorea laevis]
MDGDEITSDTTPLSMRVFTGNSHLAEVVTSEEISCDSSLPMSSESWETLSFRMGRRRLRYPVTTVVRWGFNINHFLENGIGSLETHQRLQRCFYSYNDQYIFFFSKYYANVTNVKLLIHANMDV